MLIGYGPGTKDVNQYNAVIDNHIYQGNLLNIDPRQVLWRRVIGWHIPVAMLAGLALPSAVFFALDPASHASPLFHLVSGGAMRQIAPWRGLIPMFMLRPRSRQRRVIARPM